MAVSSALLWKIVCVVVVCVVAEHGACGQGTTAAVEGLLQRLLPKQADKFLLTLNTTDQVDPTSTG